MLGLKGALFNFFKSLFVLNLKLLHQFEVEATCRKDSIEVEPLLQQLAIVLFNFVHRGYCVAGKTFQLRSYFNGDGQVFGVCVNQPLLTRWLNEPHLGLDNFVSDQKFNSFTFSEHAMSTQSLLD